MSWGLDVWGVALGAAALIIGIPALVMAVPPFLQMIWGKPKIRLLLTDSNELGGKLLLCQIINLPIKSKVLRGIGVTRSATEALARYSVQKLGTNEFLANGFRPILVDVTTHTAAMSMPVKAPLGATFAIVEHSDSHGAFCSDESPKEEKRVDLAPGYYFATIQVSVVGDEILQCQKNFNIGNSKELTAWRE